LAHLKSLSFDLIVLDVMMPGEDGFTFAARLRAGGPELARVPILMLTARSEAEDGCAAWRSAPMIISASPANRAS